MNFVEANNHKYSSIFNMVFKICDKISIAVSFFSGKITNILQFLSHQIKFTGWLACLFLLHETIIRGNMSIQPEKEMKKYYLSKLCM